MQRLQHDAAAGAHREPGSAPAEEAVRAAPDDMVVPGHLLNMPLSGAVGSRISGLAWLSAGTLPWTLGSVFEKHRRGACHSRSNAIAVCEGVSSELNGFRQLRALALGQRQLQRQGILHRAVDLQIRTSCRCHWTENA